MFCLFAILGTWLLGKIFFFPRVLYYKNSDVTYMCLMGIQIGPIFTKMEVFAMISTKNMPSYLS